MERHPVSPFMSLHHPSRVFLPATGLDHALFFRGMNHDPIGFAQLVVAETFSEVPANRNLTIAVVSGLTVRLWARKVYPLRTLLRL